MQVMFDLKSYEEPRWRKKGNKQKITDFFPFYIYCDQFLNTTKTKRKEKQHQT